MSGNDRNVSVKNRGATWHRWEPHAHAPGTLLNDQFRGEGKWEDYLRRLESSKPTIRALGVTDYYTTDCYRRVCEAKADGRLKNIDVIFPNIELRLDVGTLRGRWVNIHLLVNPEDQDHLDRVHAFLARLRFRAFKETFSCTKNDLTRLGQTANTNLIDEKSALSYGAEQFKVDFNQLRKIYEQSEWAQLNILIAVAGSTADGTSGVRAGADTTLRQEIEGFAHIVFASSAAQREFWLGKRESTPAEEIRRRYGGLKPCLHGSDCHHPDTVGKPDDDRFSWVKGALEFGALKQVCIDPAGRAFVGPTAPQAGAQSQIIDRIVVSRAPWFKAPEIAFNSGLVAIIGARGSGKTALVDIIARACDAFPDQSNAETAHRPNTSFLDRAGELLGNASVKLSWQVGESTERSLSENSTLDFHDPRVRYLSQQFVDKLCSARSMNDELLREIERVIFESHPLTERDGALDFPELLDLRSRRHRLARRREEDAIAQLSERIGNELEKARSVASLKKEIAAKARVVNRYSKDRKRLVSKGSEERLKRLTEITEAAESVRSYIQYFTNQQQSVLALKDEVSDHRKTKAPELLRRTQERYAHSRLEAKDWKDFLLDYTGDVNAQISRYLKSSKESIKKWKGKKPTVAIDNSGAFVGPNAELKETSLAVLEAEAEAERLAKLVSADRQTQRQFLAFSKKIVEETAALKSLREKLKDAEGAKGRAEELQKEREAAYRRVFQAICEEQKVLVELYQPLMQRLSDSSGTLKKLAFTVSRTADVDTWANTAETELVDLRRQGPFRGRGKLSELAESALKIAWESGDAEDVCQAMATFRSEYQSDLLNHATVSQADTGQHREWLKRFAFWLFSTDHITLSYGIDFDGVDIRKLSPGTRGIVLLLLYLALDQADDRPLVIDQPEENLDPKSVYDELVDLFVAAKEKRQVIMVTHNANLVVNTDADQIIIAQAVNHERGSLPEISYESGGLESKHIRQAVCDILEGGEEAFRERARRLRLVLRR